MSMIRSRRAQRGFSLLELAVAIVVIGLIIGAVTIGRDVQRNAAHQRIVSEFVQGWQLAYDSYRNRQGIVPGDNATAPTGAVNAGSGALCGAALRGVMQAAGIRMPNGRAEGAEPLYAYLDKNGLPQQLEICFDSVSWAEPGATPGSYVTRARNVMVLRGLTPALARTVDQQLDNRIDAAYGRVRESSQATVTSGVSADWSRTESAGVGTGTANLDETQSVMLTGYLQMGS